ncbi:MAG: YihY/virulence factor BrkB family protein [Candidatus Aminicenantes bacterium]|nr:YihY/virulence factor BrkB family protein [Candidatus Aminicenantes bacterium]
MRAKLLSLWEIIKTSIIRFNQDKCWTYSIVISYFALLCSVPLVALFVYISAKVLGTSELAIRSLNLFSDEFFAHLDPSFFKKLALISQNITSLGWLGLGGSFVAASFLFSNLIAAINHIFKANYQKSFFYNRLMEYIIMFTLGLILLVSLAITAIWTALHRLIGTSSFVASHINPQWLAFIDNFLIQYLIPFILTFLVLFSIYKFIPEIKVHTEPAAIAAGITAIFWEAFKRIFAFYVVHFSAIGIVLSKLLQGTLASIIFFLLWISFSLIFLLWGAELAALLNERHKERLRFKIKEAADEA